MLATIALMLAVQTTYTLPSQIHWIPQRGDGAKPGAVYAVLRGHENDACGQLIRDKFPDGFVYPWHVNGVYGVYTILQGTLVIGFDKHHATSKERALPAGTVVQGLATEPHYGRAIGETIFDVYLPCKK